MSALTRKIQCTVNAVDDIEAAIQEKGVNTENIPLESYGDLIRSIQTGSGDLDEDPDENGIYHFAFNKDNVSNKAIYTIFPSINSRANDVEKLPYILDSDPYPYIYGDRPVTVFDNNLVEEIEKNPQEIE